MFETEETYKETLAIVYDHEEFIRFVLSPNRQSLPLDFLHFPFTCLFSDNHYVDEEDRLVVFVRSTTSSHVTYTVTVAAPRTRGASKVPAIRRFLYSCSCAAVRKTKRKQGKAKQAMVDPTKPVKCKHQGAILISFFRPRN